MIVDDVTYFAEPFFQDGIIAQAATSVVGRGIPFFSSAGNQGNESYESFFRSGLQGTVGGVGPYDFHDFDPGPGVDIAQFVAVASGQTAILSFQWDQPFASAGGPGSANDMDIFAFDQDGILVAASANNNIGVMQSKSCAFRTPRTLPSSMTLCSDITCRRVVLSQAMSNTMARDIR